MLVVLKVIHLYALLIGAVGGMGTGILMSRAEGPPSPQVAATLGLFKKMGVVAIGLLWITGLLLAFWEYGTLALGPAFYLKLLAATVVLGLILWSDRLAAAARAAGTPPDGARLRRLGLMSAAAVFVAVVCAVIAFN